MIVLNMEVRSYIGWNYQSRKKRKGIDASLKPSNRCFVPLLILIDFWSNILAFTKNIGYKNDTSVRDECFLEQDMKEGKFMQTSSYCQSSCMAKVIIQRAEEETRIFVMKPRH